MRGRGSNRIVIAGFQGDSIPLPSSGSSPHNQSNSNAITSPINVAAHPVISHHWQNATAPLNSMLIEQVCRDRADVQCRM